MNSATNQTIHPSRRISVSINGAYDFDKGAELPTYAGEAYDLLIVATGILAREVETGYNLYRPFTSALYMTNVTSSGRFSLETDPMTFSDMTGNFYKLTVEEKKALLFSQAVRTEHARITA